MTFRHLEPHWVIVIGLRFTLQESLLNTTANHNQLKKYLCLRYICAISLDCQCLQWHLNTVIWIWFYLVPVSRPYHFCYCQFSQCDHFDFYFVLIFDVFAFLYILFALITCFFSSSLIESVLKTVCMFAVFSLEGEVKSEQMKKTISANIKTMPPTTLNTTLMYKIIKTTNKYTNVICIRSTRQSESEKEREKLLTQNKPIMLNGNEEEYQ